MLESGYMLGGMLLVLLGGEILLRSTEKLAQALHLPQALIALTLIAFGTSAPELVVSLKASAEELPGVVIGNVLGSNLANLGLVVGLCALFRMLDVPRRLFRVELPLLIALQFALIGALVVGGGLGRVEALVLAGVGALFIASVVKRAVGHRQKRHESVADKQDPVPFRIGLLAVLGFAAGLALLLWGADLFVDGARLLQVRFGLSQTFVGLTFVALGTSLPELVTSLLAVRKGNDAVALGTVLGSNVFNIVIVLGVTGTVRDIPIPDGETGRTLMDLGASTGVTLLLAIACWTHERVRRKEGWLLIGTYASVLLVRTLFLR